MITKYKITVWTVTPTAGQAINDNVLIAMSMTFYADDYRASRIWGYVFAVLLLFVFFGHGSLRERLMVTPLQVAAILVLMVVPSIGLWFLTLPIRRVNLVDGQTLQFHTKRSVNSISVSDVTELVLTDRDHEHYWIKVVTDSKAWKWRTTEKVDADRFVDAMLAINPQIPISRREFTTVD